jgi:hypothetical protein
MDEAVFRNVNREFYVYKIRSGTMNAESNEPPTINMRGVRVPVNARLANTISICVRERCSQVNAVKLLVSFDMIEAIEPSARLENSGVCSSLHLRL